VATQGGSNYYGDDQWVTKYKLQYSDDGVSFQYYKEQGGSAKDMVRWEYSTENSDKLYLSVVFYRARTSSYNKPQGYIMVSYRVINIEIYSWLVTP